MPQERPRTAMRIMEEHSGGQMRPHRAGDQIEMDRKRQANIAAKDEARNKREAARRGGGGMGCSASAPAIGARRVDRAELEARRMAEQEAKRDKRQAQIREAEAERAAKQSAKDAQDAGRSTAKYSKKEVLILFELFKEYDTDGEGSISVAEFKGHFTHRNDKLNSYDGKHKNFAERRAARAGLDLAQLVEPMFNSLDMDGSGTVSFFEILKVVYPKANEQDMATFREWCQPDEPAVKPITYVLSP